MSTLEDFAALLAETDPAGREKLLAQAKFRALQATDPAKLDAAPTLLTGEELAAERARHLEAADAIIGELGYSDDRARLAADDTTAKAARTAVADQLVARFGIDGRDADSVVTSAASGGLIEGVDLGALLRDGIPPVEYLPGEHARRMVYADGVTGFTGHPDSGKTSLVGRLALDAMRDGRHCIYLDYEQGAAETARRFQALGADDALLSDKLIYTPFPGPPNFDYLGRVWDRYPDALGVFDSTRGILRKLGLSENDASETAQFFDPLVEFALTRSVPVLLIDHVAKAANEHSMYARGSGDKLAAVQAQWFVKKAQPFSETETGEIELTRWKARAGALSPRLRFAVGDGNGSLTFRRLSADESPQGRMEADVIRALRAVHPATCSLRDIEADVDGTATAKRDAVKRLAENPTRPVKAVEESGGHPRYVYVPDADNEPGGVRELAL